MILTYFQLFYKNGSKHVNNTVLMYNIEVLTPCYLFPLNSLFILKLIAILSGFCQWYTITLHQLTVFLITYYYINIIIKLSWITFENDILFYSKIKEYWLFQWQVYLSESLQPLLLLFLFLLWNISVFFFNLITFFFKSNIHRSFLY